MTLKLITKNGQLIGWRDFEGNEIYMREKGWPWKLTWRFASNNYTTIGKTIWYPKGYPPTASVVIHERVHIRQQAEVGVIKFILLYLFCFPFGWNPWRWKWEFEAYRAEGKRPEEIEKILGSSMYGWLA